MTLKEFNPTGSTGPDENDLLYHDYITGPQGSRYVLWVEEGHSKEDVEKAKAYLKRNFDVVKIYIEHETV